MSILKTPLIYPGGKSYGADKLYQLFPYFNEYREPFVGGGSVFVYTKQRHPNATYWINDKWDKLINFWQQLQADPEALHKKAMDILTTLRTLDYEAIKGFYDVFKHTADLSVSKDKMDAAVAFFLINRLSFAGMYGHKGQTSMKEIGAGLHCRNTTDSVFSKLLAFDGMLNNTIISCGDYTELISSVSLQEVFIFCDPPYIVGSTHFYGDKGELHKEFDHVRFAQEIRACEHKFMITYNDHPVIRELYSGLHFYPFTQAYHLNHTKKAGQELIITNYKIF